MSAVIYFTTAAIFYSTLQQKPHETPLAKTRFQFGESIWKCTCTPLSFWGKNLNKSNFRRAKANIIAGGRWTMAFAYLQHCN